MSVGTIIFGGGHVLYVMYQFGYVDRTETLQPTETQALVNGGVQVLVLFSVSDSSTLSDAVKE
eukprot:3581366-Amphidinium_carterae.1